MHGPMRGFDFESVTLKQSVHGLGGHEFELSLLRAEVEQQRKEIENLRGQLLQKSPETPIRKGVLAAGRYHPVSVLGCPDVTPSHDAREENGSRGQLDGETTPSTEQETLLVQTQHIEQDSATSSTTICNDSLAATALRLASTPKGAHRTELIDTRVVGRRSPTRSKLITQIGNGHVVVASPTPGSCISLSGGQALGRSPTRSKLISQIGNGHDVLAASTPGSSISLSGGSRARRSRSTGSAKSRSPSREARQCMARQCILVPESQLQPPEQPCIAKPRLPSKERQESQSNATIPFRRDQQTQPKQPRPCKLESCPRPRPVTFVASTTSPAKAEVMLLQLRPQATCSPFPRHQFEDGVGVVQPAPPLAAAYATAGMRQAVPACGVAPIPGPSTATLAACHLLHAHCAAPHTGQMADLAGHVSSGQSIRSLAHPRVDATTSATHLSRSWLATPPLGTAATQLGHGREVAEWTGLHYVDGRKLLDQSVETLPHTGRRRSTSPPASKRKVIVAL